MKKFIKLNKSFFCIDSIIAIEPSIDNDFDSIREHNE